MDTTNDNQQHKQTGTKSQNITNTIYIDQTATTFKDMTGTINTWITFTISYILVSYFSGFLLYTDIKQLDTDFEIVIVCGVCLSPSICLFSIVYHR